MEEIDAKRDDKSRGFLPFVQYVQSKQDYASEPWKRGCFNRCMYHPWIRKSESECTSVCGL